MSSVVVRITTDASQFSAGIQRANADIARLKSASAKSAGGGFGAGSPLAGLSGMTVQVETLTNSFGKLYGAVAAVAAGGAFGSFVVGAVDRMKMLNSEAKVLGIGTAELSRLHYAATMTSVANETMDAGLEKLTLNIQKAASGGKEMAESLAAVGLDARELVNLTPDQQFLRLAAAMEKTESQGQRLLAAHTLLGRANTDLVKTLAVGEKGLLKLGAQSDAAGYTVPPQFVADVTASGKAVKELKLAMEGVANVLAVGVSPMMQAGASAVKAITSTFTNLDVRTLKLVTGLVAVGGTLAVVVRYGPVVVATIGTMVKALQGMITANILVQATSGPAGWAMLTAGAIAAAAALAYVAHSMDGVGESSKKIEPAVAPIGEELDAKAKFLEKLSDDIAAIGKTKAEQDVSEAHQMFYEDDRYNAVVGLVEKKHRLLEAADAAERAKTKIAELQKAFDTVGMNAYQKEVYDIEHTLPKDQQPKALQLLNDRQRAEDSAKAIDDQKKKLEELQRQAEQYKSPFERAQDAVYELNRLLAAGVIDADQYGRYTADVAKQLNSGQRAPAEGPRSLTIGSKDEAALRMKLERQDVLRAAGLDDSMQKRQLQALLDQLKTQREIASNTRNTDAATPAPMGG